MSGLLVWVGGADDVAEWGKVQGKKVGLVERKEEEKERGCSFSGSGRVMGGRGHRR
jgi:hypothetical protein